MENCGSLKDPGPDASACFLQSLSVCCAVDDPVSQVKLKKKKKDVIINRSHV